MLNKNLNVEALRTLLSYYDRREELLRELDAIDNNIANILAGKLSSSKKLIQPKKRGRPSRKSQSQKMILSESANVKSSVPNAGKAKSNKRVTITAKVLKALKKAGPEGLSIKEISEIIDVKAQSLYVWFSTTGSKMNEIKRVSRGRYALA